jgi:hypothetical protein
MRPMTLLALCAILVLAGCASSPVSPVQAISQMSSIEGSGVIGSVFVGPIAITYPVRWSGSGRLTIQYPAQPYVITDGDLVIEPFPESVAQTEQAVATGVMSFRHGETPVALSPVGTIKESPK